MPMAAIEPAILRATGESHPLDVSFIDEEDLATPWQRQASKAARLSGPMPAELTVTLANLVFEKAQLPQSLSNRLVRLAAYQSPDFYKAQAMRLSVRDKPRVIGSAENFPQHIGLPRGCLEAAMTLLHGHSIRCEIRDVRQFGDRLAVSFTGLLRHDQEAAVAAMMRSDIGVLCAPTAFGKTVTAAALFATS